MDPDLATMTRDAKDRWWAFGPPRRTSRGRLFCFPFAGGGASVYRPWRQAFAPSLDVCPVQLPGREARIREPAFRRMAPLVEALLNVFPPWLDAPYALFGYSMGALVAYELAHRLRESGWPAPNALFVAASGAPRRELRPNPLHALPDNAFMESLRHLDGTPEEVLAHAELMELLLPTLRADFELCEMYTRTERPPLDCALVAFGGTRDSSVSREDLEAWGPLTRGAFRVLSLEAGHFFLTSHSEDLIRCVTETLSAAKTTKQAQQRP